ncbi:PD-(D/E)XK nuclease family transposase [Alkalinema pantanalense CENA528]|uniref:PD-(D/E)XK nuclease family transposase n=1 Tax=Alkalinema pantanalense TaxID=1620705 RepID=UPI003D6E762F
MRDRSTNLPTDFGCKRLFGTEPNQDLLIDFFNTILRSCGGAVSRTPLLGS